MTEVNDMVRQIDLLVDGELNEIARRDLLLHLDREIDGWRHCALAFLEAQTWQRGLDEMREPVERTDRLAESIPQAPSITQGRGRARAPDAVIPGKIESIKHRPTRDATPPEHRRNRAFTSALAIVAGLMAAFVLGSELQRSRLAANRPTDMGETQFAEGTPSPAPQAVSAPNSVAMPLENWTMDAGESIPSDVLESLQRLGHRVERHQEFWPYNFDDGRRFLVPVERVEVRYVGNSFQ